MSYAICKLMRDSLRTWASDFARMADLAGFSRLMGRSNYCLRAGLVDLGWYRVVRFVLLTFWCCCLCRSNTWLSGLFHHFWGYSLNSTFGICRLCLRHHETLSYHRGCCCVGCACIACCSTFSHPPIFILSSHLPSLPSNKQNRSVSIDPSRKSGMQMELPQRFLASSVLAMAFLGYANAYVLTIEE